MPTPTTSSSTHCDPASCNCDQCAELGFDLCAVCSTSAAPAPQDIKAVALQQHYTTIRGVPITCYAAVRLHAGATLAEYARDVDGSVYPFSTAEAALACAEGDSTVGSGEWW